MQSFLDQLILGNPVRSYLILAVVLLVVFAIKRFLSKGIANLGFNLVKHWSPQIERQELAHLLLRPLEYFLVLVAFMLTIDHFRFPPVLNVAVYNGYTLRNLTNTLLQIAFCICILWILLRLIDFVSLILEKQADLTEDTTDNQFIIFFRDFFKALISIFGLVVLIRILFGSELVNKLIAGLGIGAAALALAAKESIENLIGSFIIFFDKPFRVGDSVKVDSYQGTVEKIGLRSTRIRTLEKTFVTVPNKKMVDSILDNLTLRTQQRVAMKLELPTDTPSDTLLQILKDIQGLLNSNRNVLPGFTVNLHDFNKDTYLVQIIYNTYIIEGLQYAALREAVNLGIIRVLEQHGVKLPSTSYEIQQVPDKGK
ncbi:MAG TPA: mechanosensitive ion channel domain-containing protein [Chitinophaga sp.]|uniref:mechanosensitive ion channel family protein n=1 Tax=Chitinophaga sp. TaxID=1869181 RepID=UPI002DB65CAC|nr:mechanosensitive ion channel domain-containing protein [Chitinophaga sp.]HEU4553070.1 mechanosensitive ion channel domain-containing protein [Chitinophaga sp.]